MSDAKNEIETNLKETETKKEKEKEKENEKKKDMTIKRAIDGLLDVIQSGPKIKPLSTCYIESSLLQGKLPQRLIYAEKPNSLHLPKETLEILLSDVQNAISCQEKTDITAILLGVGSLCVGVWAWCSSPINYKKAAVITAGSVVTLSCTLFYAHYSDKAKLTPRLRMLREKIIQQIKITPLDSSLPL